MRRIKPRSSRVQNPPKGRFKLSTPVSNRTKLKWPTLKGWVDITQILANFVAAIGGGAAATAYVTSEIHKHVQAMDEQYSGTWNSFPEGCIDCKFSDTPPYKLYLTFENGKLVDGYGDFGNYYPDVDYSLAKTNFNLFLEQTFIKSRLQSLLMEGERSFGDVKITIYDFNNGKKTIIGHARLHKVGDDFRWQLQDLQYPFFKYVPKDTWITHFDIDEMETEEVSSDAASVD